MKKEPQNVKVDDIFFYRRKYKCKVVDITKEVSIVTGEVINYRCYAKAIEGLATNVFEVPFSTVAINKI